MKIFHLVFIFLPINGKLPKYEKEEFCENLECDESVDKKVCGVKWYEEDDVIFKLFDNECKLLKYGCRVDDSETYGIINMKYCTAKSTAESENIEHVQSVNTCGDCSSGGDPVCGIRPDGEGYKIRTFANACRLNRYNCEEEHEELHFTATDFFICSTDPSLEGDGDSEILKEEESPVKTELNGPNNPIKTKNLFVVDGSMLNRRNINESISQFFAATHVLDLPVRDIQPMFNESTRRRIVNIFGPIKVYTPWIKIPKNITVDYHHLPTLASCYHRCPTECPDTYKPVCGVPGVTAREPSLMFLNHCFMDIAQCKMYRNGTDLTSQSSAYIEASFVFCLGSELNGMFRFLPLIRTLQHMGRLKKRGHYRYKLKNMKFFNNLLAREPKLMG